MKLHEYQCKALLAAARIPTPKGLIIDDISDLAQVPGSLGQPPWIVKAQIHAGGRAQAGGIRRAYNESELHTQAEALLGKHLKTPQTGGESLPVNHLLIEAELKVKEEFYVGLALDRSLERVVVLASRVQGLEMVLIAQQNPEAIMSVAADLINGLQPFHCRELAFQLGLNSKQREAFTSIILKLYQLYVHKDLTLLEINPLALMEDDSFSVIDAKASVDDNALYRQTDLQVWRDPSQEDDLEQEAIRNHLSYVRLSGNIGCMVNGAGLSMATADLIKLYGGDPANFLDVGGDTDSSRVAYAFRLILSDPQVSAILINIFGGLVRCDLLAQGILSAAQEINLSIPLVVRLEGTHADTGEEIFKESDLQVYIAKSLDDAVKKVVKAAQGDVA